MNLASPVQLDIIDGLRGLGISNYVPLPLLAVVGDQSRYAYIFFRFFSTNRDSGKSSVLESFSELPFPRDSGLCTRFATQIIFRRSATSSVKVSILAGPDRSTSEGDKLREYVRDGMEEISGDEFLEILKEVGPLPHAF